MLLIFKLVGCGKLIEIRKNITGDIGLKECRNILQEYGLSEEDFKSIKIIANGKDAAFMRLTNRIKILELNMSLSSQYLEKLSQHYRFQKKTLLKKLKFFINLFYFQL
jgi:hypothetical protein